jgi:hypothetical protein
LQRVTAARLLTTNRRSFLNRCTSGLATLAGLARLGLRNGMARAPAPRGDEFPQVILTPQLLKVVRDRVAGGTAQWQAFKRNLDANLNVVSGPAVSGAQMALASNFACGYQALKTSDPASASAYADKAIAMIVVALRDYQAGTWMALSLLATGDGRTTEFTLPQAPQPASTFMLYQALLYHALVLHGGRGSVDTVRNPHNPVYTATYFKWIKVSNQLDGSADYAEGVDWRHTGETANDTIDWSLGSGKEPIPPTVVTGGSGYRVDDVLTVQGGTVAKSGNPARLRVETVDAGGAVTNVRLFDQASCTYIDAPPANPVGVTGGHGSGATFNLGWYYATGASYYEAASKGKVSPRQYTLAGNRLTIVEPALPGTALFVEYLYDDPKGNTHQQTGSGDGGYHAFTDIDSSYPCRFVGHLALAYDWLLDYPGFSPALQASLVSMLKRLYSFMAGKSNPAAYDWAEICGNYGGGNYFSRMMIALALLNRDPAGAQMVSEMQAWQASTVIPDLTRSCASPGQYGSWLGGYPPEGWFYAQDTAANILEAMIAAQTAGILPDMTTERKWASRIIESLYHAGAQLNTTFDSGTWYQYFPAYFPKDQVIYCCFPLLSGDALAHAQWLKQHCSAAYPDTGHRYLLFYDPAQPSAKPAYPVGYRSEGVGAVFGRADWSFDSTWFAFQCGNVARGATINHQYDAQGVLEIRRGGDYLLLLATNYTNTTGFAYSQFDSCVAVDDNGDKFQHFRWSMGPYDGQQCSQYAFENTADYLYCAGDFRAAFATSDKPGKGSCTLGQRQIFYLRPDYFVVHDRVGTVKPDYPKQVRWTSQAEAGAGATSNSWLITSAQPARSRLFGQAYASVPITVKISLASSPGGNGKRFGQIVVAPVENVDRLSFTTVLQSSPAGQSPMDGSAQVVSSDRRLEGVQFDCVVKPAGPSVVLFGATGAASLSPWSGSTSYSHTLTGKITHHIADVEPQREYKISVDRGEVPRSATATANGVLIFTTRNASGTQTVTLS